MIRTVGTLTATTLCAIGALHIYWAAGGSWGSSVTVPSRDGAALFQPPTCATLLVAFLLFAAAAIVLGRAGFWSGPWPSWLFAVGSWVLTLVFAARVVGDFRFFGLFKKVLGTDFATWDTWLFVPLCALLALGCAIVALGSVNGG
jgi:hypothetical protein